MGAWYAAREAMMAAASLRSGARFVSLGVGAASGRASGRVEG